MDGIYTYGIYGFKFVYWEDGGDERLAIRVRDACTLLSASDDPGCHVGNTTCKTQSVLQPCEQYERITRESSNRMR